MSSEVDRDAIVKKSAELLRSGAKMLSTQCPLCGSPLFMLKTGEVVCPLHGRVIVVEREEEAVSASLDAVLMKLEEKAAARLSLLLNQVDELGESPSPRELQLLKTVYNWLRAVRASREIRAIKSVPDEGKPR